MKIETSQKALSSSSKFIEHTAVDVQPAKTSSKRGTVQLSLHCSLIFPFHILHSLVSMCIVSDFLLVYLLRLPCHIHLVIIEQQQQQARPNQPRSTSCIFPGFLAISILSSSNNNNNRPCHIHLVIMNNNNNRRGKPASSLLCNRSAIRGYFCINLEQNMFVKRFFCGTFTKYFLKLAALLI